MSEDFKIWWEEFPTSDKFTYQGKKFQRTRALRLNEKKCEKKFNEILEKKGLTLEDMLNALRQEILSRQKESYRKGVNQMTFLPNSQAYLNGGTYEAWLDDEDDEEKEPQNSPNAEVIDPKDLF